MENKVSQYLRMSEKNSTVVKLEKLFALADELKIRLSCDNNHIIVDDEECDKSIEYIQLLPIEQRAGDYNEEMSIPPRTEYKLVYENPAYIKQRRLEIEEYQKRIAAELEEKRIANENAIKQAEIKRLKQIEDSERAILDKLKAKYGEH